MSTLTPMTDAELARLGTDEDQGFGALTSARGHLPLVAMRVDARVTGLTAGIELEQTFANTLARADRGDVHLPAARSRGGHALPHGGRRPRRSRA